MRFQEQSLDEVAALVKNVVHTMYGDDVWREEREKRLRALVAEEFEKRNTALIDSLRTLLATLVANGRIQ